MSEVEQIRQVLGALDPTPIWKLVTSATPAQWSLVLLGPVLAFGTPWIQKIWPQFGGGKPLFRAPLKAKLRWWHYWMKRSTSTLVPVVTGLALIASTSPTAGTMLLLGGLGCTVFAAAVQRRVCCSAVLLDRAFKVDGILCTYETILASEPLDDGFELRTKGISMVVTREQFEHLKPSLWRTGIGAEAPASSSRRLRGELDLH